MEQLAEQRPDNDHETAPTQAPPADHDHVPSRRLAAAFGLAAAGAGLAIAEVVAGLSPRLRSPVLDVGDRVIDRVPTWLKDLAIDWFGTNDKPALLAGIWLALALFAAVIGVVGLRRRLAFGVAGAAGFALIGSLAALSARTGRDWLTPLPSITGGAVAAALIVSAGRRRRAHSDATDEPQPIPRALERRELIVATGAIGLAAFVTARIGRLLQSRFDVAGSRSEVVLPRPANRLDPTASTAVAAQADGAAPFFTSNADFYRIDTALSVPQVPIDSWELRVTGMVDDEIVLDYGDLLRGDLVESDITLTCVSNLLGGDLIGTARWLGLRLDDLLARAGVDPRADQIVGRSVDGYTCGFPVAALDGRDALVAIGMNGEPLPLEHGFPARLIVPGIYGYASATKWLTEIELTTFDEFDHYWVPRGYAAQAPIKLQSRIDTPRGLDRIAPGPFVIGGVAWAQPIGISAVEVRIDEGDWQPAELAAEVNGSTWRQWSLAWDATPGRHTIAVRAIDQNGAIQTAERSEPLPDGTTGHHTVVVLVDEN